VTVAAGRLTDLRAFINQVTEMLPVTERVFYDLKSSQPMVEELARRIRNSSTGGRVLVIAPNEALARVLLIGYETELWEVPSAIITDDLRQRVSRMGPLDDLLDAGSPADPYDAIVLPYVIEAVTEDPGLTLARLAGWLRPGGILVIGVRLQVAGGWLGRVRRGAPLAAFSLSWPTLPTVHSPELSQLRRWWSAAGLELREGSHVIDRTATVPIRAMSLKTWLAAIGAQALKRAIPGLRDGFAATLVRATPVTPLEDSATGRAT
jgi:hypothetical protein